MPQEVPFVVFQVSLMSVRAHQFGMYITLTSQVFELRLTDISPIPLTEEWILRAGFKKEDYSEEFSFPGMNGVYLGHNDFNEKSPVIGDYDACVSFKIPKYVHQLQNLYFCLTGEELVFKLD